MLTIFSTPKPFRDHFGIIQTNALESWLRLHPPCEIILFGDEEGAAETASHLGVRHIPKIARSEWGTPLISSLFEEAQKIAINTILCYVNADIILMSDFLDAVQRLRKKAFLMVGQRWNLEVNTLVNFDDADWESNLRAEVDQRGVLEKPDGLDYFVFPKGTFFDIPPFSVGRPGWDNWMIYHARRLGISVIDATPSMTAIHQIHDYSHHPQGKEGVWRGQEAEANLKLLGGNQYAFTLWDADRILELSGLKLPLTRTHLKRRLETVPILFSKGSLKAISLRLIVSAEIRLYDWLSRNRVSRAALATAKQFFKLTTNITK